MAHYGPSSRGATADGLRATKSNYTVYSAECLSELIVTSCFKSANYAWILVN